MNIEPNGSTSSTLPFDLSLCRRKNKVHFLNGRVNDMPNNQTWSFRLWGGTVFYRGQIRLKFIETKNY